MPPLAFRPGKGFDADQKARWTAVAQIIYHILFHNLIQYEASLSMSTPIARPLVIDSTGRIVLPSEVRRRLNLRAGSRLRLDVVAERIELTPEPEAEPDLRVSATKRAVLRPTGRVFDAAVATRAERDAQARRRRGR